MKRKPLIFSVCYLALLFVLTAWILLDQFVIVRKYVVEQPDTAETTEHAATNDPSVTADPAIGTTEPAAPTEPIITDRSYICDKFSIVITEERYLGTTVQVAEIKLSSPDLLKTAFAENTFGRNVKDTVQNMAEDVDAVFAINGDYYGYRKTGFVVRNGTLYRDSIYSDTQEAVIFWKDGSLSSVFEKDVSAKDLVDKGAMHVLSFGPTLIADGEIVVNAEDEVNRNMKSNPRTAIGMVEPLHYFVVVSDGRLEDERGLSVLELARFFKQLGCTFAYNLDGGGSATMVFMGEVLNFPTSKGDYKEREVSDIVYIGKP